MKFYTFIVLAFFTIFSVSVLTVHAEEPANPFYGMYEDIQEQSKFLSLSLKINGVEIDSSTPVPVPFDGPVRLDVAASFSRAEEAFAPYEGIPLDREAVIQGGITGFHVYKGVPGNSTHLTNQEGWYGTKALTRNEHYFTEPGKYFIVFFPSYYPGHAPPGLRHDDLCPGESECTQVPSINYLKFINFLVDGIQKQGYTRPSGILNPILYGIIEFEVVDINETPRFSSVAFLPGIKGSRLYKEDSGCDFLLFSCDDENELWPPINEGDVKDLFLSGTGLSNQTVYVKDEGVFEKHGSIINLYTTFLSEMETLETEKKIKEFKPLAYDWRLSLDDLVEKGIENNNLIDFSITPPMHPWYFYRDDAYLIKEIKRLANESYTGKVTLIGHSNGGLLAKKIVQALGEEEASRIIDDIILVGAPQAGAPQAFAALLFGHGEALPKDTCAGSGILFDFCSLITGRGTARALAENAPMAYHLLPSQAYFDAIQEDTDHPVGKFTGLNAYGLEFSAYGENIDTWNEMRAYLLAEERGREKPKQNAVNDANILNPTLLDYAKHTHDSLDFWTPPEGVKVYQIAGWGLETVSGVEFIESPNAKAHLKFRPLYRPMFVDDGDTVVPIPSALLMPESEQVQRWWFNFDKFYESNKIKRDHKDFLEITYVQEFIYSILAEEKYNSTFLLTQQPSPNTEDIVNTLRFHLHSSAPLIATSVDGETFSVSEGNEIEGAQYGELGGMKYLIVPDTGIYTFTIKHPETEEEVFIEIEKVQNGKTKKRTTIANIPLPETGILTITTEENNTEQKIVSLSLDTNGDNEKDISYQVQEGVFVIHEEVVIEEQPIENEPITQPEEIIELQSDGGGGTRNRIQNTNDETNIVIELPIQNQQVQTIPETQEELPIQEIEENVEIQNTSDEQLPDIVPPSENKIENNRPVPQNLTASVYDAFTSAIKWLMSLFKAVYTFIVGV